MAIRHADPFRDGPSHLQNADHLLHLPPQPAPSRSHRQRKIRMMMEQAFAETGAALAPANWSAIFPEGESPIRRALSFPSGDSAHSRTQPGAGHPAGAAGAVGQLLLQEGRCSDEQALPSRPVSEDRGRRCATGGAGGSHARASAIGGTDASRRLALIFRVTAGVCFDAGGQNPPPWNSVWNRSGNASISTRN